MRDCFILYNKNMTNSEILSNQSFEGVKKYHKTHINICLLNILTRKSTNAMNTPIFKYKASLHLSNTFNSPVFFKNHDAFVNLKQRCRQFVNYVI